MLKNKRIAYVGILVALFGLLITSCTRPATTAPTGADVTSESKLGDPSDANSEAAMQTVAAQTTADAMIAFATATAAAQQIIQPTGIMPTETPVALAPVENTPEPTATIIVMDEIAPTAIPQPVESAQPAEVAAPTAAPVPVAIDPNATTYTVQSGDWLWQIARNLNIDPVALMAANPSIDPNNLSAGQVLQLPGSTSAGQPAAQGRTHTVQPGENLYRISLGYGLNWHTVAEVNGLVPPYTLMPGQTIVIP